MTDRPSISTADLHDANEGIEVCDLQFRSFGARRSFYGRCVPIVTLADHRPVLAALSTPGEGRVLVVDAGGGLNVGVIGDRLVGIAIDNGWAGAVIFGAIRDSDTIAGLDFGLKALGATARRAQLEQPVVQADAARFGGVTFAAGDWIYADADAVVRSAVELRLDPGPPAQ